MPVDRAHNSHSNHASRRTSTDDPTRQREQELRRARGEIACIECQRLKLKCDRKVPCASCIRRNRAAMCPNGHAWSDQETRSLLSDTAQLHRKLNEMSQRIRQLEDALEISHTANSSNAHPLLREELLAIKRCVAPPEPATKNPSPAAIAEAADGDYVEAMGTMTITDRGVSRFIGGSGGSESLIMLEKLDEGMQRKPFFDEAFPPAMSRRSEAWLLMPPNANKTDVLSLIEARMPPFARASSLCETYLENFSWVLRVVERTQLFEELLPFCYRHAGPNGAARIGGPGGLASGTPLGVTAAHELALLLAVFAAGALADLTLPAYNDESEQYYQLALAALSTTPVLGAASLPVVQAVGLMAAYNAHCGRNDTLDLAGSLFNVAASLAVSMGLHRDVAKWNVGNEIADRRRQIFWELFTLDGWHNIANGKPCSYVLKYVDCKFPEYNARATTKDGQVERSYWDDRHTFALLVYDVMDLFSRVEPVRYSQVLEIDRKISEHITVSHLQVPTEGSSMEGDGPLLIMQRLSLTLCNNALLMYIHRGFFAKALLEHPRDPMHSAYAHSYLSAYRAALGMIKTVNEHFSRFPDLVSRFWSLWSHAFSATVIIGSIVIKSRDSDTVRNAMLELNMAVSLFEKAATSADRAKRSLPTIRRLHEKARKSASVIPPIGDAEPSLSGASGEKNAEEKDEDELLIFTSKDRKLIKPKTEPHEISLSELSSPVDSPQGLATPISAPPLSSSNSISRPDALNNSVSSASDFFLQQQLHARRQLTHPLSHPHAHAHSVPPTPTSTSHSVTGSTSSASIANSNAPSSHSSPGESILPPDADAVAVELAMSLDLPGAFGAWSAWSDQEALLINYLSSGADFNLAQSAAFAGENDGRAYAWPGAGFGTGVGVGAGAGGQVHQVPVHIATNNDVNGGQQQQQMSSTAPLHPGSDPGKMGMGMGLGMNDQAAFSSLFPDLGVVGMPQPSSFVSQHHGLVGQNHGHNQNQNNIHGRGGPEHSHLNNMDRMHSGSASVSGSSSTDSASGSGQPFPVQDGMTPWDMFM